MPDPAAKKPRRRLWKVIRVLALLTIALSLVSWQWGHALASGYGKWRIEVQLEIAREALPEIVDHKALVESQVHGRNGWDDLSRGRELCFEFFYIRSGDSPNRTYMIESFGGAYKEEPIEAGAVGEIEPSRFEEAIRLTGFLTEPALDASRADCIVQTSDGWILWAAFIGSESYLGVLATRILILSSLGRDNEASLELSTLVELLAKVDIRYSKRHANMWCSIRNDVLEFCLLPLAKAGKLDGPTLSKIADLRWHTPGTDPVLWINNAAATYAELVKHCGDELALPEGGEAPDSRWGVLYHELALAEWMEVCKENALAAKSGELDLRDDEWLSEYRTRFETGWHPINYVSG